MTHQPEQPALSIANTGPVEEPTQGLIQTIGRVIQSIRRRLGLVIGILAAVTFLGGFYYVTADKIYQADASLLVTITGNDDASATALAGGFNQMPTFENLATRPVVLQGALRRLQKAPETHRVDFIDVKPAKHADVLKGNLSVSNARRTNSLDFSYRSKSPEAAEAVLTAIVESYLDFIDQHHHDVSLEVLNVLTKEQKAVEKNYRDKQQELLKKQAEAGDLGIRDGSQIVHPLVQRVITLNESIISIGKQRVELEAAGAAVQQAMNNRTNLLESLAMVDSKLGQDLFSQTMGLTQEQTKQRSEVEREIIDDQARLDTIIRYYGDNHFQVLQLRQKLADSKRYLAGFDARLKARMEKVQNGELGGFLLGTIRERLNKTYEQERRLQLEYEQKEKQAVALNNRLAELQLIESEVARWRSVHSTLQSRIANLDISEDRGSVRVSPIGDPKARNRPVSPRLVITLGVILVLGLGLGGGAAWLLDILDDRFNSPEELSTQLATPILASVRNLPDMGEPLDHHIGVLLSDHPDYVECEAFRTLRTHLTFSPGETERLAVTSTEPGDGKTTTSSNLAVAYALSGKRTLIIDADMRKPGLSRLFSLRGRPGLSDLLRSDGRMAEEASKRRCDVGVENLTVIPCGPKPTDPLELLNGPRLGELLAWAETEFDQILIDCPPLIAASDAGVIGRQTDGLVLVIQPMKNHRRTVLRMVENVRQLGVNLLGVVLNRLPVNGADSYGYGAYGYGYGDAPYGADDSDADHETDPSFESVDQPYYRKSA